MRRKFRYGTADPAAPVRTVRLWPGFARFGFGTAPVPTRLRLRPAKRSAFRARFPAGSMPGSGPFQGR